MFIKNLVHVGSDIREQFNLLNNIKLIFIYNTYVKAIRDVLSLIALPTALTCSIVSELK